MVTFSLHGTNLVHARVAADLDVLQFDRILLQ